MNYAPFSDIGAFPSTETIWNLTIAHIPSSPGDSDSSQDHDIIPDASADVSPRNSAYSSSDSTFLHIGFTFLHSTPCLGLYPLHSAHRTHQTIDSVSSSTSQLLAPSFLNSYPMRNNPIKLNINNLSPSSNLPPGVYDHISRLSCLHALGMKPF